MVRIPQPQQAGQPVGSVEQAPANTPSMNVRPADMSAPARDFSRLADVSTNIATQLVEQRERTALAQAEKEVNELTRRMYDPQTGIYSRVGADAAGVTQMAQTQFDRFKEDIMTRVGANLTASGKAALEARLEGYAQSNWQKAASHELGASRAYEGVLMEANMEAARERASIFSSNPEEVLSAIGYTDTTATAYARDHLGYSGEALNQYVESQRTATLSAAIMSRASSNPEQAMELLEAGVEGGLVDVLAAQKIRNELHPMVVEQKATREYAVADALDRGAPLAPEFMTHESKIEFQLEGKNRPNPPSDRILNVIGTAAERIFGKGTRIVVTSGQEDPGKQYGSTRHGTGDGADFYVVRPDGRRLRLDDPETVPFLLTASSFGVLGIGAGAEYMGDVFHMDLVEPDPNQGQDHEWGSLGNKYAAQLKAAREAGQLPRIKGNGQEYLNGIEDPEVRAAAFALQERNREAAYKQRNRVESEALDQIFTIIDDASRAGTPLTPAEFDAQLSIEVAPGQTYADVLGSRISSAREYAEKRASTGGVQTYKPTHDRLKALATDNPTFFAQMNLADYRTQMNDNDFAAMLQRQTDARGTPVVADADILSATRPIWRDFDTAKKNDLVHSMVDYTRVFQSQYGRPPTPLEMLTHAELMQQDNVVPEFNQPGIGYLTRVGKVSVQQAMEKADDIGLEAFIGTQLQISVPSSTPGEAARDVVIEEAQIQSVIEQYRSTFAGETPRPSQVLQMLFLINSDEQPETFDVRTFVPAPPAVQTPPTEVNQ